MFCDQSEKNSIRRGSFFVQPPSANSHRVKLKTVFSIPSVDELPDRRFQFDSKIDSAGDHQKSAPREAPKSHHANNLDHAKSKTLVLDKKNMKYAGHFSKLKKKSSEDYSKFLEQQSKNVEVRQMQAAIEKIQNKVEELGKVLELKTMSKISSVEGVKPVKFVAGSGNQNKKLYDKEFWIGIGLAFAVVSAVLLLIIALEGKNFFASFLAPRSLKSLEK